MVRDLSATTTASTSVGIGASGTPIVCTVRIPPRTRVLARSVAPVKSSAMQPRSMTDGSSRPVGADVNEARRFVDTSTCDHVQERSGRLSGAVRQSLVDELLNPIALRFTRNDVALRVGGDTVDVEELA